MGSYKGSFSGPSKGGLGPTWRFMGSYKGSYKSLNMGYNYSYLTYNPTCNYP